MADAVSVVSSDANVVDTSNSSRVNPKWLFLDLDGTIADSLPGIQFSIRAAFDSCGKTLPLEDLRSFIGPGIRTILKNLDTELLEAELDVMERSYRESYDACGCLKTTLYPGVYATLQQFSNSNLKLFVITNKPKLATANILKKFELTTFFCDILSRDSRNPNYATKAEMLLDLIVRHNVDPTHAWVIGDTAEDWKAAREAKLSFVYAAYGYGNLRKTEIPTISDFSQLLTLCTAGFEK